MFIDNIKQESEACLVLPPLSAKELTPGASISFSTKSFSTKIGLTFPAIPVILAVHGKTRVRRTL